TNLRKSLLSINNSVPGAISTFERVNFQALDKQDLLTGKKLADSLKKRIKQRRLYIVVGALQYLHNPNQFLDVIEEDEDTFKKPTYEEIKNVFCQAAVMNGDNLTTTSTNLNANSETICDSDPQPSTSLSYKDQLNRQLSLASDHQLQPPSAARRDDLDLPSLIHVEMALFENGGGRGEILKKVFNKLLAIPPTSVESERAFSTAGVFCSKLRSRLNDDTLDCLLFLKKNRIAILTFCFMAQPLQVQPMNIKTQIIRNNDVLMAFVKTLVELGNKSDTAPLTTSNH
ncbi:uncharacterized protein, partial [Choristoneura fumiferana]|uniref:uncharacterized protein n=1 Tax=Choristoneura fumiferana TaxID=7141 RepID=UPI003D155FD5